MPGEIREHPIPTRMVFWDPKSRFGEVPHAGKNNSVFKIANTSQAKARPQLSQFLQFEILGASPFTLQVKMSQSKMCPDQYSV